MDMDRIRNLIIGFALVSLIAAAGALALDAFRSDQMVGENVCGINGSYSHNITCNECRLCTKRGKRIYFNKH